MNGVGQRGVDEDGRRRRGHGEREIGVGGGFDENRGCGGVGTTGVLDVTTGKLAGVPVGKVAPSVQMTWPVPPAPGEVQVQPVGAVMLTNVVLGGVC